MPASDLNACSTSAEHGSAYRETEEAAAAFSSVKDFTIITELPGDRLSQEGVARFYHRYLWARSLVGGKRVLEVGCGGGQGLGFLLRAAASVTAGDFMASNLLHPWRQYCGAVQLAQFDAQRIPFRDGSFDAIVCLEVMYYMESFDAFLTECRRLLRPGGLILLSSVNKYWRDFIPSPFCTRYLSIPEIHQALRSHSFRPEVLGAFRMADESSAQRAISRLRRIASALHLVPRAMKSKELLKRIFYGTLVELPREFHNPVAYLPPTSLSPDAPHPEYKIYYAAGQLCVDKNP